uniref:Uncharacterized protein n=1 Tax=Nelumbo nucifera TaxID=4432 RepID=A0A822Z4C9_NELNU|nr:TPA_asm: hypothetical protein HUJ06_015518 [Nelumbo nucifera]
MEDEYRAPTDHRLSNNGGCRDFLSETKHSLVLQQWRGNNRHVGVFKLKQQRRCRAGLRNGNASQPGRGNSRHAGVFKLKQQCRCRAGLRNGRVLRFSDVHSRSLRTQTAVPVAETPLLPLELILVSGSTYEGTLRQT